MPECPCLILGDLNAEPEDLPTFQYLTSLGWTNLGASAALWDQVPNKPTCVAPGHHSRATIRDYILASPMALPLVAGFSVDFEDTFVTHAVLRCSLDLSQARANICKLQTPSSLTYMVQQSFLRKYHVVCAETPQQHCSGPAWADHLAEVAHIMDARFNSVTTRIEQLCSTGATDEAWLLWSQSFELAIIEACNNVDGAHHYRGHGIGSTEYKFLLYYHFGCFCAFGDHPLKLERCRED